MDSASCSNKSIFTILSISAAKANESVLANFVCLNLDWGDVTENTEGFSNLLFCPILRKIFDENIVKDSSEFSLASWCILNSNNWIFWLWFNKSFFCTLGTFKGDESVAFGVVLFINWNFAGDDITKFVKLFCKAIWVHILRDLSNKQVMFSKFWNVDS